jgi:hypothetical protein
MNLSILERRLEIVVLYGLNFILVGIVIAALLWRDWILVGICLVGFFFNGLIGGTLPRNRGKSFSELAATSAFDPPSKNLSEDSEDLTPLSLSLMKASYLAAGIAGAVTYHFDKPWWAILIAMLGCWAGVMIIGVLVLGVRLPKRWA